MSYTRPIAKDKAWWLRRSFHSRTLISIVTPVYNEAGTLPELYKRLRSVLESLETNWEWVVVDDHSCDETPAVLTDLVEKDDRLRSFRFARNFGSHTAIKCGLDHAWGDCAVVMAADLQDPPEIIQQLLAKWRRGAHVVWAVRSKQRVDSTSVGLSRLYFSLIRRISDLRSIPEEGTDFLLIDRPVIEALRHFSGKNVSIFALITWMGFRQEYVTYEKQVRLHGVSGWNLKKKLKLVVDSIAPFTYFPIRLMSYVGFATTFLGLLSGGVVVINALRGLPPTGWAPSMVVALLVGGIQMIMLGVMGEYLWRTFDEVRRQLPYIIESELGQHDSQEGERD